MSFAVEKGELFGFIGPDGAGKTTLFRILVSLLVPGAGRASVLDLDVVRDYRALRQRVGYMAGRFSLYPDLSVEENLTFFASVFGTTIQREYEQIKPIYTQLEPFKDRRAAALSGGMNRSWRSAARWSIGPTSSFSTSRRPASTPCRAASSGICSAG